ncbi:MAG: DUF4381 family protein [Planctomycetes bacterium]|nr:DUF4381 family protein [Planctomycetota bacterium]
MPLLLLACGGPAPPWRLPKTEPLDLALSLSAEAVALLEPVTVQIDLYRRADLEVEFVPEVDRADFLVEREVRPEVPFGDGFWRRTTLVLRPRRGPAELVLPAFTARSGDGAATASTPARTLRVGSTLAGHDAAVEAPGEPFPAPPPRPPWLVLAAALLLALLLGAWFRRRRRERPAAAEVALPPHVKAQRALQRLRTAPRATAAQVEAFYVGVSDVLRTYLEERFGLRAPERTTEEFLRDLEGGDQLAREHRAELERFLRQCDLVKFAAAVPGEVEHLATFALAEAFVEATRGDRAPAEVRS